VQSRLSSTSSSPVELFTSRSGVLISGIVEFLDAILSVTSKSAWEMRARSDSLP
jgi:hypothetical protein